MSHVPPDFPSDKSVAGHDLRLITFRVEEVDNPWWEVDNKQHLTMYQSRVNEPQNEVDEIPESTRWILGPEIDVFSIYVSSMASGKLTPFWDIPNSLPSRLKVELAFKGARIDEIL